MSASSNWHVSEAEFPVNGTPRQKLGYALKYAMLAPTETNWQPWEFRLTDGYLDLIARNEPVLDAIDTEGRESTISCGAALLCLKLALKHFGCLGRVELFPDLDQPTLAARIHHGSGHARDDQEKLLFDAMAGHGVRSPFPNESPVSEMTLAALGSSAVGERGWVEFARSELSRQRLMKLAFADGRQPTGEAGIRDHSALGAGHRGATARSEAFTVSTPGWLAPRWTKPLLALATRRYDLAATTVQSQQQSISPTAMLAIVKTKTDDKHGWLAAGHTMARLILQAQAWRLPWSFFNQAVRRREVREALRLGIGHKGFAQVILRLGVPAAGETVRPTTSQTATATAN